tara:strand:+ start:674 stop:853 length:180 start_codon:yes stop_codon:yes gene_type:complete
MSKPPIFSLIKTECGQSKYLALSSQNGLIAKLRLYWFIFFAIIKDWNLKVIDQTEESNS